MPVTTDKLRPDTGEHSIGQTKGLWTRINNAEGSTELFLDGVFQVAWDGTSTDHDITDSMVRYAFDMGLRIGEKRNQDAMKEVLGWGR